MSVRSLSRLEYIPCHIFSARHIFLNYTLWINFQFFFELLTKLWSLITENDAPFLLLICWFEFQRRTKYFKVWKGEKTSTQLPNPSSKLMLTKGLLSFSSDLRIRDLWLALHPFDLYNILLELIEGFRLKADKESFSQNMCWTSSRDPGSNDVLREFKINFFANFTFAAKW